MLSPPVDLAFVTVSLDQSTSPGQWVRAATAVPTHTSGTLGPGEPGSTLLDQPEDLLSMRRSRVSVLVYRGQRFS